MKTAWQKGTVSIVITSRNSELTAATLWTLTRIFFHEDYKVRRRCFPQVLFESCADGHGSASGLSLFYASFSSFLYSLLWGYCFSFPASTRPKQKWRLRPKRLTLPRKTPFSLLFLFSSGNQSWLINASGRRIFYTSCGFAFWVMLCYPLHHNYFNYEYYLCGRIMQQMNTQWWSESYF